MKKLLLSIVALGALAANAFAVDVNSSWDEIETSGLYIQNPTIPKIGISVFFTCLEADGTTLNGGNADVCAHRNGDGTCAATKTVDLKTSIHQTADICTQRDGHGACEVFKTESYQVPLHYEIPVFNKGKTGVDNWNPLFTKPFTIQSCRYGTGGGTGGDN